ncbi:MAG TPA: glycoside hydrolase family 3 C-terminal domain-containing protein [Candidatus Aquilonibacter sp.]|nr:glycoside hydrolase family 3 C-terminal domain-containing protein [Candidatus Aquilonibacter sp.]
MPTRREHALVLAVFCLLSPVAVFAQAVPQEKADGARIERLLKQMTLEEKMNLIRGATEPASTNQGQAGYLPGVPRLGVPSLRFADGPPGLLTRVASEAETATMGVAATFSLHDAQSNGVVIGREARANGIDVVLQPFINIDRDITFTRGYNTFGEDPFLTGRMGAAEIRGAQSQDVMAQAKHYVGYDSNSFNTFIDPQTLHEVYVAPFEQAVKAGVASIMCSYNRLNGFFACDNADTLKTILKGELGFKGFVTSDWGAVHSALFINNGLDMEMPGILPRGNPMSMFLHTFFQTSPNPPALPTKPNLAALAGILGGTIPEEPSGGGPDLSLFPRDTDNKTMHDALANGSVTEATITAAARRVLYEMDRFGYLDGKQKHNVTPQDVAENAPIIEKTAEDSAVLLKNEDDALPLKAGDLQSLAMIGPTARQVDAIGTFGERSPGLTERQVGPVAALLKLSPSAKITFAVDDDMTGSPVPAADFSHDGVPGLLRTNSSGQSSVDETLDFTRSNGKALPANSDLTWKGQLAVPADGDYWLYLQVLGARGMITVDGKELGRTGAMKGLVHGDIQYASQDNALPTTDGLDNVRRSIHLTSGKHNLEVHISGDTSDAPAQVRLNWMTPEMRQAAHQAAVDAARSAKTAVVFVWTRGKPVFALPGHQDQLVEDIAAVNPNTIVVLNTSQPVAMPWLGKVKAVLEMWWPGDEGGWATAKTLLGQNDPAGRLPVTWARRLEDYPATDPAHPERSDKGVDGKTTYSEGVLVGYRWFDAQKIDPLFPFGYGLSYTQFAYSNMKARPAPDGSAVITVRIRNTGKVAGDEVPQVYLDAPANPPSGVQFSPRTLVAFDRVSLKPGESRVVTMEVPKRAFEYWSVAQNRWVKPAGKRVAQVGASSRDLYLSADLP